MADPLSNPQQIREMIEAYKVSQAILAAVELGIPDLLGDGRRSSDDLAEASGTHAPTLYRLLRALASAGVLDEQSDRIFAMTAMAQPLRTDVPGSVAGFARLQGREYFWQAWGHLAHSVRSGETAFEDLHGGQDVWSYRGSIPQENEIFNAAMVSITNALTDALLAAYDFSTYATICDIGGGSGVLLASILRKHTNARGIVFDLPHVVEGAVPIIEWARVSSRCATVGGDMFASIPDDADAYTIKHILHDWNDEDCVRILKTAQAAMKPGAKLLVIERIVGPPNEDQATKFMDLNMLVLPGGLERTEPEWRDLLTAGGFTLKRIVPTATGLCVLEAVPN